MICEFADFTCSDLHPYSKIGTSVSSYDQGAEASSPLVGYG
jgi:hypothetical protein